MKTIRKMLGLLLTAVMVVALTMPVFAAKKAELNFEKIRLAPGETLQLQVEGDSGYQWKSSDRKIAAVDSEGLVTAKANGTCSIAAIKGDKKLKCTIIVGDSVVLSEIEQLLTVPGIKDVSAKHDKLLKKIEKEQKLDRILKRHKRFNAKYSWYDSSDNEDKSFEDFATATDIGKALEDGDMFYTNGTFGYSILDGSASYYFYANNRSEYEEARDRMVGFTLNNEEADLQKSYVFEYDGLYYIFEIVSEKDLQFDDPRGTPVSALRSEYYYLIDAKTYEILKYEQFIYTDDKEEKLLLGAEFVYDGYAPGFYCAMKGEFKRKALDMKLVKVIVDPDTENEKVYSKEIPSNTEFFISEDDEYTVYEDRACTIQREDLCSVNEDMIFYMKKNS